MTGGGCLWPAGLSNVVGAHLREEKDRLGEGQVGWRCGLGTESVTLEWLFGKPVAYLSELTEQTLTSPLPSPPLTPPCHLNSLDAALPSGPLHWLFLLPGCSSSSSYRAASSQNLGLCLKVAQFDLLPTPPTVTLYPTDLFYVPSSPEY